MLFLQGLDVEKTMFLFLTEQDINDIRGTGRYKFIDQTVLKGATFGRVVINVVKNQAEAEEMLRQAGHGKLLKGLPSPVPDLQQGLCRGCGGTTPEPLLLHGKCIACWRDDALAAWGGRGRPGKSEEERE
jgi:hypothetical protein